MKENKIWTMYVYFLSPDTDDTIAWKEKQFYEITDILYKRKCQKSILRNQWHSLKT